MRRRRLGRVVAQPLARHVAHRLRTGAGRVVQAFVASRASTGAVVARSLARRRHRWADVTLLLTAGTDAVRARRVLQVATAQLERLVDDIAWLRDAALLLEEGEMLQRFGRYFRVVRRAMTGRLDVGRAQV